MKRPSGEMVACPALPSSVSGWIDNSGGGAIGAARWLTIHHANPATPRTPIATPAMVSGCRPARPIAIAASELDGLYQAFPGFLDAACFVLPDPIVGDRIFAAVAPSPNAPVSLEALHRFLMERGVAPYKFPDKLLVVKDIPRDTKGRIIREAILKQV